MTIYKLTIETTIEYEYEEIKIRFYLTKEDMKKDIEKIKTRHTNKDGSWIPNISSMRFYEEEVSFEDTKDEMTIAQYEELFNTTIGEPV